MDYDSIIDLDIFDFEEDIFTFNLIDESDKDYLERIQNQEDLIEFYID